MHTFDPEEISLKELTKIQGSAALDIKIENQKVKNVSFKITEFKRFYTQAIRGKFAPATPQILSRICGTCSSAHLMATIEAVEKALDIQVSPQIKMLRMLTMYAMMIRDHALHLYLFVMPDLFEKDYIFELDENDPFQHQFLHDAFEVKAAGNFLSQIIAGRSVHAPYPIVGGFTHFPIEQEIGEAIKKLEKIRPAALRLIELFLKSSFQSDFPAKYVALSAESFGFLEGNIISSEDEIIKEADFRKHLEHVVIPYSQASGYTYEGKFYIVGALARLNLARHKLHPQTQKDAATALTTFPSTNIFHNNLAQAIEILHSIDDSIRLLKNEKFVPEAPITYKMRESVGVGVVEAPRGTLYHKLVLDSQGIVKEGEVIMPTNQNQISIERNIGESVQKLLPTAEKEKIVFEIEKLIRAYDPCMSCASHFLKVKWN